MPAMISGIDAPEWAALVVATLACAHDLRNRRIPNWLTFGGAGFALAYAGFSHGFGGFGLSLAGWFTACVAFLPFFVVRGLGAGDVKLAAALGAWLLPGNAIWMALYAMLAGGLMAIVIALIRGLLRSVLANAAAILWHWRAGGLQPLPGLTLADGTSPRMPYALPLAVGAAAVVFLE